MAVMSVLVLCVLGSLAILIPGVRGRRAPNSDHSASRPQFRAARPDKRAAERETSGNAAPRLGHTMPDTAARSAVRPTAAEAATVTAPSMMRKLQQLEEAMDPTRDGWRTEVLSERATGILKSLVQAVKASAVGQGVPPDLPGVAAEFEAKYPGEEDLQLVYDGRPLRVRRASGETRPSKTAKLPQFIDWCRRDLQQATELRSKVKLFAIDPAEDGLADHGVVATRAYVEWSGVAAQGRVQHNAEWQCQWRLDETGNLQLQRLEVRGCEQKISEGRRAWFVDRTADLLGGVASYEQQLRWGANEWIDRVEERLGIHDSFRNGLAVGDANGDGLEDLYVCQSGGLPNRLYLQTAEGRAVDVSHEAGVDWLDLTSAALFVDLDNDGDQDLVIAIPFHLLMLENEGAAKFRVASVCRVDDEDVKSLSAADYDHDSDLDIYLCVDLAHHAARPDEVRPPFVYHDANDGGRNVLLQNQWQQGGGLTFVDATAASGLDVRNRRHSLAAAWEDFDNDGDQDLYVANDYGKNCLYRNDGGQFVEVAEAYGVTDAASGMSVAWGDYDQNGRMDLYVANMWSSAGGRVTRQQGFQTHADDATRTAYQRFAKGNTLFANRGDRFDDVGALAGVEMGRWAWSSLFADLNNDSWQDLVIANGYLTTEDSGDL